MPGTIAPRAITSSVVADWVRSALTSVEQWPGVHRAGIALVEGGGRRLRFTSTDRLGYDESSLWCYVDGFDDVPLNTVIRTGEFIVEQLDALTLAYPRFTAWQSSLGTAAVGVGPLTVSGRVVGGLVLYFRSTPDLVRTAERMREVGASLGVQLRHAQRSRERDGRALADEPLPARAVVAHHQVPADAASVSVARQFLRAALESWSVDDEIVDGAVLCLSEVVTNALIHTTSGCSVRVLLEPGVLTVAVRDHGSTDVASTSEPEDALSVQGRGLQIVEALASRWGFELDVVGTTVWFTFEGGSIGQPHDISQPKS